MNALLRVTLAVVVTALPVLATAGDDDEGTTTGHVLLGAWFDDEDGSPDAVAEYQPTGGSPALGLMMSTHQSWGSLLIAAHGTHSDQQDGVLSFDLKRALRSETTYTTLLHRLGHDPMTNLEATSNNGKVVFHEDLDPLQEYDLTYRLFEHRTEIQLPNLSAVTLAFEYRDQQRKGHRQAFTTSHCDTCHVTSQSHALDEKTTDATFEAKVGWRGGSLSAALNTRDLRQGIPNLWLTFDDALHPELQVPVFDNRLQYDSAEGVLPVDLWSDIDKDTVRIDLHLNNVAGFVVNGGAVFANTTNRYTGLESDYSGYALNAARRFDNGLRLRWRARAYSIDNDEVWVDTIERTTMAGPHAGNTYEDIYGINYDWRRESTLNREGIESKLDLSYRFSRKAGTLRLAWDFENIDRQYYQVLPGELETTTHKLGLYWKSRPAKGWKVNASLVHASIDNPFMLVDGACSTLESPGYPNPWSPETPQYDDQHQAQIAETTASPSSWDEARLGLSYTSGKTSISASYRLWDGDNRDGHLTDWSRTNQTAMLTLWSAPSEEWEWYLAYAKQESELDAPMCIPIFDG
jgi:hypothetical protein